MLGLSTCLEKTRWRLDNDAIGFVLLYSTLRC